MDRKAIGLCVFLDNPYKEILINLNFFNTGTYVFIILGFFGMLYLKEPADKSFG